MNTLSIEQLFDPEVEDGKLLSILERLSAEPIDAFLMKHLIDAVRENSAIEASLQAQLLELGRQSIDCSGTGGSGLPHFNTSTSSAFVLAAAGLKVAKFGGRAASGKSGSFDFLDGLGISSAVPHGAIIEGIESCGVSFIFAAGVYPQLRRLAPIRKQIGKATVLNYIGPLLNPLRPAFRVMGVSSDSVREQTAKYLAESVDCVDAFIVTADGQIDELTPNALNRVSRIQQDATNGSRSCSESQLEVGNVFTALSGTSHSQDICLGEIAEQSEIVLGVEDNLRIFNGIVAGDDKSSVFYKTLLLNSAAGLMVGGIVAQLSDGVKLAAELIGSGQVASKLEQCRRFYGRFS